MENYEVLYTNKFGNFDELEFLFRKIQIIYIDSREKNRKQLHIK